MTPADPGPLWDDGDSDDDYRWVTWFVWITMGLLVVFTVGAFAVWL